MRMSQLTRIIAIMVLQQSAASIANWSIDNGMRINTMKTKEMIIRFCRDPVFLPYINIDGAACHRKSLAGKSPRSDFII